MTAWAQLLHFYQPPTQTHDVLVRVAGESYRPLLTVLKERPKARLAVNVNGVLTELLLAHGLGDIVESLRLLVERGQVELVGSGKYHPILPLIHDVLRQRAIAENAEANVVIAGARAARGFFPPELCYSDAIIPAVAEAGHDWMLLSGVACPDGWPTQAVTTVSAGNRGLALLFRDDVRSNRISFRETTAAGFVADLQQFGEAHEGDSYVVTAMDAETYGHHIAGWERGFLAAALDAAEATAREPFGRAVHVMTPSELVERFPAGPALQPLPSSWSTSRDDIAAGNPYPLWRAPGNEVHGLQWQVVEIAQAAVEAAGRWANGAEATRLAADAAAALQPALHSCQFWWASRRPMWEPVLVERGLALLTTALLYAERALAAADVPPDVRRELDWRFAAAQAIRDRLERILFLGERA